jgi:hypothetical protein
MSKDDQNTFKDENLLRHVNDLSNSDMKQFIDMQTGLRKGSNAKLNSFLTKKQAADSFLTQMNVDPKKKSNRESVQRFYKLMDERSIQFEKDNGRPVNNNDLRSIGEDLSSEFIIEKSFLGVDWLRPDKKVKFFELTGEDVEDIKFIDIPVDARDAISKRYFERFKKKPTPDKLTELYIRGIVGN